MNSRLSEEASTLCSNDGYTFIGPYVNLETPMLIICPFHGRTTRTMKALRHHKFCPKCQKQRKTCFDSDVEFRVYRFFLSHKILLEIHPKIPNSRLALDFFFPDHNLYLEIDGSQHWEYVRKWHRRKANLQVQKDHDLEKTQWCKDNQHLLFRWCIDELTTFSEINAMWDRSISTKDPYFISHPHRYPHLC